MADTPEYDEALRQWVDDGGPSCCPDPDADAFNPEEPELPYA